MITKSKYNFQILAIPSSILSIVLIFFCYYLMQFVELIVHGELYEYGLIFSYEWANQYWNYSTIIKDSIMIFILLTILTIIFMIIQIAKPKKFVSLIISILIIFTIFFLSLSFFSLTRIDFIVHNLLYNYGLQFSYDWSTLYWNNLITIYGLFLAIVMLNILSFLLVVTRVSWVQKGIKSFLRVNSLLLIVGVVILFFSTSFNSSVLVFIGLGCVFWGAILLYVRSGKYVKEELLLTATSSMLASVRELILELGYKGKAIYLPPKYLKDFESSKVFINKTTAIDFPSEEKILDKDTIMIKNPKGLLITPPGFDLSRLFEETLNTNFTQQDLSFVEENIQKLLVEDLEIVRNVQMEIIDNLIHIRLENSVYKNMGTLSSAIACMLAKTSGNLVIIENRKSSSENQIIDLDYRLFESPIS
jgi:hypothetical protein